MVSGFILAENMKNAVMNELRGGFRPEFLNRIDDSTRWMRNT
jgi:ATP-dependent Clp protease ATP-binding subunit ClpA